LSGHDPHKPQTIISRKPARAFWAHRSIVESAHESTEVCTVGSDYGLHYRFFCSFAQFPTEWQIRNFSVGNKRVEFGLRLPNNLILPIDSKWPATNLLEQFTNCEEPTERRKLKVQIENVVLTKAKEVRKYIDPHLTESFAIAVIPDAVYELSSGILVQAFQQNVVLVSVAISSLDV